MSKWLGHGDAHLGAELLFEVFSRRHECSATLVASNPAVQRKAGGFRIEAADGSAADRLTHHVHILELNGESYRLKDSKHGSGKPRY